jgi:MoaA/NifB/PqqE/SkfB family radical SAM enzyme
MNESLNNGAEGEIKFDFCCLTITDKCMFKCKMCHIWHNASSSEADEPSIENWKQFIASFVEFTKGKSFISFTGGEVLMSDKTLELISFATELGADTLLNSNAYLINEDMATRIHNAGLKKINLSLDSFNEENHDFIRGTSGSYARVMKAIEYLHRHAVYLGIHINTVIMESNLDHIIPLTLWALEDVRLSSIHFQAVSQPFSDIPNELWYEQKEARLLWPKDKGRVEYVLDELIKLKGAYAEKINNSAAQFRVFKSYFNNPLNFVKRDECHMYKDLINVSPFGDVQICNEMPVIGNIKNAGFDVEKIWYSSGARAVRDSMRRCRKNCAFMVSCSYEEEEKYIS